MLAEVIFQGLSFPCDFTELKRTGMLRAFRNRLAQLFLCRLAETRQRRNLIILAGLRELSDRADPKFFVERLNFLCAKTGNRKQLQNIRRKFRAELVVEFERTG